MKYSTIFQIIKRQNNKKNYPLRIRVSFSGQRVDLRPGISIPEEIWDAERQQCSSKSSKYRALCAETNARLFEISNKIDLTFQRCEICENRVPTIEEIKSLIDAKPFTDRIKDVFARFLEENVHLEKATRKIYKATLAQIIRAKGNVYINEITYDFMVSLVDRLSDTSQNSSIATFIERLRTLLKWAVQKKIYTADGLRYKFKLKLMPRTIVHLSQEELLATFNYEPKNETEQNVIDAYCFCAFTGLRFSDCCALTWDNVSDNYIDIITKKTSDMLRIDLNKYSRAILAKHRAIHVPGNKVFKSYTAYYHEKILKRIFKRLGFNEPVTSSYCKGHEHYTITRPKWQCLTTHTARKTFVVNALTLDIPIVVVMKWTGHKSMKTMEPYIKLVDKLKKSHMDKFDSL